jgi:predicted ATPase
MSYPLNRIKIKGFKSIKELDLKPTSLNILIGANGAGKSNFKLLNNIAKENLQVYVKTAGGANSLLHFGRKNTDAIEGTLYFDNNEYEFQLLPSNSDNLFFGVERLFLDSKYKPPNDPVVRKGHDETQLQQYQKQAEPYNHISNYVLKYLVDWKVYHFHDTSDSAKVKQTGDINDNEILKPDASNLAAFLFFLKEKEKDYYDKIVQSIRLVAPFFDDFNLRPSKLNPEKIQLEWKEKGSDEYFNAHYLSDGTLRYICLATLLLQPKLPSIILIDEPELGLHPYAIVLLASLIRSASHRTQLIISTQSVQLVNQFEPENIIVTDKIEGQSHFKKLTQKEISSWMDDFSLGELWEKNVLGGRPQ